MDELIELFKELKFDDVELTSKGPTLKDDVIYTNTLIDKKVLANLRHYFNELGVPISPNLSLLLRYLILKVGLDAIFKDLPLLEKGGKLWDLDERKEFIRAKNKKANEDDLWLT